MLLFKLTDFENEKKEKEYQTKIILSKLMKSKSFKDSKVIGLYMPTPIEFDLTLLFEEKLGKKILIPKVLSTTEMVFVAYAKDQLERSRFGLLEPKSEKAESPDLIVAPGLAWNFEGHRIGFGGGYYDRYLKNFKGRTLSCCYDFQRLSFEPEPHDIKIEEIFSV